MTWNIIDRRNRKYRWARINAIIEDIENGNDCEDSDQAPHDPDAIIYDQREGISLYEPVSWATEQSCAVTLYLYDEGDGTTVQRDASQIH